MCGIAGYYVKQPDRIRPSALQLLAGNLLRGIESRGRDATGYAYVSRNDVKQSTFVCKAPLPASEFLTINGHLLTNHKPVEAMPHAMVLHTRFATQGRPSDNRNNHPVYSKDSGLCMVHNGWFIDDDSTIKQFQLRKDAEVDTETYLRLIEKFYLQGETKTVESGIQQATQNVWGSLACAMIQGGRPGVMWLWRDQGQLEFCETDWGYVFASTRDTIIRALHASCRSIDLSWYDIETVPRQSLLVIEDNESKPQLIELESPKWDSAPESVNRRVIRYNSNGEEVVRRSRGGTTVGSNYQGYIYDDEYYGEYYSGVDHTTGPYGSTATGQRSLPGVSGGRTGAQNGQASGDANSNGSQAQQHSSACVCDKCVKRPERPANHLEYCQCSYCKTYRDEVHAIGQPCGWGFCSICHGGSDLRTRLIN